MLNHFADGSGSEYTNQILTDKVKNHETTIRFMKDFASQAIKRIDNQSGKYKLYEKELIREDLEANKIFLSKYSYGGTFSNMDTYSGLSMAIHGWTECEVRITEYNCTNKRYSGNFQFTFIDNFGLDLKDINKIKEDESEKSRWR